ncbi:MAG: adenosylmethionine--8-amino-7-oxononanoate transaminase [Deltaproteobacteria bacterium]|nr:adenosylmethionine--8-amino-7-oxononanoate transaminase [Deltaproteobacteria bacterium]
MLRSLPEAEAPPSTVAEVGEARRTAVVRADKAHVWHPYTAMKRYVESADPLVLERASGPYVYDLDGRRFLDANASWWVAVLGHAHPRLVEALRRQSEMMPHVALAGVTHEPVARLAEELVAVAPPGLTRVFFSDDGSTAVEAAMKMALHRCHLRGERRTRFVALEGAFHGETLGCASVGGVELFRRPFAGVVIDCLFAPSPASGEDDGAARAIEAMIELVRREAETIAAVVVEPLVQGASGMRMYPASYLRELDRVCRAHDVLWIADEVFTGYGRTGRMWACDHAAVTPDILCTAKGFSGGMLPMGATLVSERVFAPFAEADATFHYGHSFCGNPLGAAVAREVLAVFRDERILERTQAKAQRIAAAFESFRSLPGVVRARSLGMIGALDLSESSSYLGTIGWRVYEEALRRGAWLRPLGDTVYVTPPLTIGDDELERLLSIVEDSVRAAGR